MTSNISGKNKYCSLSSLKNESDVEQFFVIPLLADLGYTSDYLGTKATIEQTAVGKGKKRKLYIPDYIAYAMRDNEKPVLILDAKHPDESVEDGVEDAQLYASVIRRRLRKPKPDQYCVGTNGHLLIVKHFDSNDVLHSLDFTDFTDENPKFEALRSAISRDILAKASTATKEAFEFSKLLVPSLMAVFEACHNLIWKKEKIPPAEAFYEFSKLLFVKLRKDREIHQKMKSGTVNAGDFEFSVHWIESLESATPNPINSILFARIRDDLEDEISAGTKKRMFDRGENIKLSPSTIKEVIRLLEHYDLYSIDEDLNGRMFETFLTAVIRGRSLGQFFTPRSVVKFMVDVASLTITRNHVPRVVDACCGTGGFLIESLARLTDAVRTNPSLSGNEREKLHSIVLRQSLWGIEANETIARIARINMYLHQDGGSRIYHADSLDKALSPEHELSGEAKRDFEELKTAFITEHYLFDIVLTNPPFAMRYEAKKKDEKRILKDYELAKMGKGGKLVASLRSSVMFIERYYDLIKDGGLLLTIIDDSVLNTSSFLPVRNWIHKRFIIRAIVSLPKNCFVAAGSNAKTSILVLQKKTAADDQPAIFMAKSANVGHRDNGKPELELNDLPAILAEWNRFRDTGTIPVRQGCFIVTPDKIGNRLDVQWYDPEYLTLYEKLESVPHFRLDELKPTLRYGASLSGDYKNDIPFLRIENLRRNDIDLSDLQSIASTVHLRAVKAMFLKEGDILIARSGTYVGLCAHVSTGFENYIYGSYIIRLRLPSHDEVTPKFLAIYLNSQFGQMQFDRLKTGSLQFNINTQQIRDIIVPKVSKVEQEHIVKAFEKAFAAVKENRQTIRIMEAELSSDLTANLKSASGIGGKLALRDFLGA